MRRLFLAICLAAAAPALAQTPPIRIGLSAPLSGPDSAFGQGLRFGAEQAVADLNRAGGRRFMLTVADDGGDSRQAAAVAAKFVSEGTGLIVGPFESSAVAVAAPVYERAGAVIIAPGVTYGPLARRGLWNLFRLGPSDPQQARAAADAIAKTFSGRPIGIVSDRTTFGRGLADAVAARLHELGQHEAVFEGIDHGTRDFSAVVGRLAAAKVVAVYFGGLAADAAGLLRAMREAHLGATLVASDGILGSSFAALGAVGEGTMMTLAPEMPRLAKPGNRAPEADSTAAGAYAAVQLLAQGLERGQALDPKTGRIDGRKVAQALRGSPFKTVLGTLSFDARGEETGNVVAIRTWRRTPDGRLDYAIQDPPS